MWYIYPTLNYPDETEYVEVQGPWTLERVNTYIRSILDQSTEATSVEFILVPA